MPATTRSQNKQPRLEDFPTTSPVKKSKRKTNPNIEKVSIEISSKAKKVKTTPSKTASSDGRKDTDSAPGGKSENSRKIIINRAPVLELWPACVTEFLHPDMDWSACMSAGKVIATLCAVAKGRSIGAIEESQSKDKSDEKRKPPEEPKIEVMQFKLQIKNKIALFAGKPKPGNEAQLMKKFDTDYENVKHVFKQSLESWKSNSSALNSKAFGFYEQFRPNVTRGQAGWGSKGELDLDNVEKTITKTQTSLPPSFKKE